MTERAITREDIKSIVEIERRCFEDAWKEEMFLSLFSFPFQYGFLVEDEGQVCGYCCLSVLFEDAELLNIATDIPYRNRGVASRLLKKMWAKAKELGATQFFLEVRKENANAIALYEKFGFQVYGERANYYGQGKDALLMKATL